MRGFERAPLGSAWRCPLRRCCGHPQVLLTAMRKERRAARSRGCTAPAQRLGRVGLRDTPRYCAPHRGRGGRGREKERGGRGRETPDQRQRGGSRVGNIRVIRRCLNPGHTRVLRPSTVRPGRARGLGRQGGSRGPWDGGARAGASRRGGARARRFPAARSGLTARRRPPREGSASAPAPRPARGGLGRFGPRSAAELRVPTGLRRALPAPPSACPGAGGRALGRRAQASAAAPAAPQGSRYQRPRRGQRCAAPGGAPVPGRPAVPFVALGTPAAVRVGTASTAYFAASGRSRLCALVRRLCALVIPQPLTFSACMESRACLANRAGLKILTASASHP